MSAKLAKINLIRNMAVFQEFHWDSSVATDQQKSVEFGKINIIYGRNYSGKTTLSRIIRSLEIGTIADSYKSPEFQVTFGDGSCATQSSLANHEHVIRVFNEDFIRDNLQFVADDEKGIKSFAVLGENNARIEEEIREHEFELGSNEDGDGLLGEMLQVEKDARTAEENHQKRANSLDRLLKKKANGLEGGIKHNKVYGDANYNVTKLKKDISAVTGGAYSSISNEKADELHDLLAEKPKPEISALPLFRLNYEEIASRAKELVEKQIQVSEPIQELLSDAALAAWVRDGRRHHQETRSKCAFCGNDLPAELWAKLDKHFNQESESLRQDLELILKLIEAELSQVENQPKIDVSVFYCAYAVGLEDLEDHRSSLLTRYCENLTLIETKVKERIQNILVPGELTPPGSIETGLSTIWNSYEEAREQSNACTSSLSARQSEAREKLRLHDIHGFVNAVGYFDTTEDIECLAESRSEAEEIKRALREKIDRKRKIIAELRAQLRDESKGANRVNEYLNGFFGHQSLSLNAIEESTGVASSKYQFEVIRNGERAFMLSEGERSLIAFCYFMAKLGDIETEGEKPIIWIDDPICSLDLNHIFFVYSLIQAEIVFPKTSGQEVESEHFGQLFVSTHNLDFLKYLRRVSGRERDPKVKYFVVSRTGHTSQITLMPDYLKKYVSEFNFLFHQIYRCAYAEISSDESYDCFYNFGNNARKFLELSIRSGQGLLPNPAPHDHLKTCDHRVEPRKNGKQSSTASRQVV